MCLWGKKGKRYYEGMNRLEASLCVRALMACHGFLTQSHFVN